ncbi:branched-chain amino acid ABC transporter permease [Mesorhizobium australafricanum]|uniref:Branched-chain amino acid ABC transporter permease n=1 Tax=Mesorhizobium australafricanum TaxID=3072311 RepID=A0ABU4WZM9_9HYPH|nr:branched-chain amino acid ABC transporter permease [Mesorhizobium sp. VK3E]MDX8440274.1 branched-chain amino acid ABC transporter permease [Mesorhizobium sp. VK3E]
MTDVHASSRRPRIASLSIWLISALIIGYAVVFGGYIATIIAFALIYAVFVSGLNIFMGLTAQVSFGQSAFAAIGGYASAVLTTTYEWTPLPAMLAGIVLALAAALLIGIPTLRLKGHYLSMATLAIGLITYEIAVEWESVTQGYLGISGIPPLGIGPFEAISDRQILLTLSAIVAVVAFGVTRIRKSRLGRAFAAVAGSEEAAGTLGINVTRYKLLSFLLAAALASISGSLFVHVVGYVSPEVFGLHMVILAFTMIYIGGLGTVAGPIIGALIVSLLPELFRSLKESQDLAYGVTLILILIYAPKGLTGLAQSFDDRRPK